MWWMWYKSNSNKFYHQPKTPHRHYRRTDSLISMKVASYDFFRPICMLSNYH